MSDTNDNTSHVLVTIAYIDRNAFACRCDMTHADFIKDISNASTKQAVDFLMFTDLDGMDYAIRFSEIRTISVKVVSK